MAIVALAVIVGDGLRRLPVPVQVLPYVAGLAGTLYALRADVIAIGINT